MRAVSAFERRTAGHSRPYSAHPGQVVIAAYIALGSNLGDRSANIGAAVKMLSETPGVLSVRLSALLDNPPVGMAADAPRFLNGVAEARTTLGPRELLAKMLEIERSLGRARQSANRPDSRPIDLDLLLFDDRVIDEPDLKVPHPRMRERRFVLEPLVEIAPDVIHPAAGLTAAELLRRLGVG